jgi:hypothetical protein
MMNINVLALKTRIDAVLPTLNEYQSRIYLAAEAKAIGYGGITLVSRLSGVSRPTLTKGVKELVNSEVLEQGRCRKAGGGRKSITETQPGVVTALQELLEAHTKGDPMRLLLWTNKSLKGKGFYGLLSRGWRVVVRTRIWFTSE